MHTSRPSSPARRDPGSVTSRLQRGDHVEPRGLARAVPPGGPEPEPAMDSVYVEATRTRRAGVARAPRRSVRLCLCHRHRRAWSVRPGSLPGADLDGACVCGPDHIPRGASRAAPPDHGRRGPGLHRGGAEAAAGGWPRPPAPRCPGHAASLPGRSLGEDARAASGDGRCNWLRAPLPDLAKKKFLAVFSNSLKGSSAGSGRPLSFRDRCSFRVPRASLEARL